MQSGNLPDYPQPRNLQKKKQQRNNDRRSPSTADDELKLSGAIFGIKPIINNNVRMNNKV